MILFSEYGRLGNQLFQYAALRHLFPKQKLVLFGCDDLSALSADIRASTLNSERFPSWLDVARIGRLLRVLADWRILGSIAETRSESGYQVKKKPGFFFTVYFCRPSFFQHQSITDQLRSDFSINPTLVLAARDWVGPETVDGRPRELVFVHVRRGDYLEWPTVENPAVLDLAWYEKAMQYLRNKLRNPIFLVVSDDPVFAQAAFPNQKDVRISPNNAPIDFALMSLCDHGILSASSFAWWGAFFSRQGKKAPGLYLAPKYWVGHGVQQWYPAGFVTKWITYLQ